MKKICLIILSVAIAAVSNAACADSSARYLVPQPKAGEKLTTVFSKAVSIRGEGFDEFVARVSGTATDTILSVKNGVISESSVYRYDGHADGTSTSDIREHGTVYCYEGKCAPNDETSAALFDPLLWGQIPQQITMGTNWTVRIDAPWEIGPKGEEQVRVVRLDRDEALVTLERKGHGDGPSSDDARSAKRTITSQGKTLTVTIIPGPTQWEGLTTVSQGETVSDEIIAQRHVKLVADSGETFEGEERVYTLLIRAPDVSDP